MYKSCLERLGCDTMACVNTLHLKERFVFQIPGLQCYNNGRDVYLAFRDDVEFALHKAHEQDCNEKAMHLAKTAAIVRKDMLTGKYSFSGSFKSDCQAKSVPLSVLSLDKMILYGPEILKNRNIVQEKYKPHLPSYSFCSTTSVLIVVIRK